VPRLADDDDATVVETWIWGAGVVTGLAGGELLVAIGCAGGDAGVCDLSAEGPEVFTFSNSLESSPIRVIARKRISLTQAAIYS
jgi:hypothetical protein